MLYTLQCSEIQTIQSMSFFRTEGYEVLTWAHFQRVGGGQSYGQGQGVSNQRRQNWWGSELRQGGAGALLRFQLIPLSPRPGHQWPRNDLTLPQRDFYNLLCQLSLFSAWTKYPLWLGSYSPSNSSSTVLPDSFCKCLSHNIFHWSSG